MTRMTFDDDVVIVTGAGRGLGREHALAFAARGAAVVVNDPGVEPDGAGGSISVAQSVVDEIAAAGGSAIADTNSVTTADGARAIVQTALDQFGKVTILVNNAGIIDFATLEDITDVGWQRMVAVTLDGAFQMSKALWPHFVAQGHGRIVNTTSNAGFAGNEQLVHYGAAKMGVAGFTKALSREAVGTGITVNAIAPMAITRMNRDAFFGGADPQSDDWQEDIRTGKAPMGPASAVSPTVLWLAHRSTTVNGDIYSQCRSFNDFDSCDDVNGRKRSICLSPDRVGAHLSFDASFVTAVAAGREAFVEDFGQDGIMPIRYLSRGK